MLDARCVVAYGAMMTRGEMTTRGAGATGATGTTRRGAGATKTGGGGATGTTGTTRRGAGAPTTISTPGAGALTIKPGSRMETPAWPGDAAASVRMQTAARMTRGLERVANAIMKSSMGKTVWRHVQRAGFVARTAPHRTERSGALSRQARMGPGRRRGVIDRPSASDGLVMKNRPRRAIPCTRHWAVVDVGQLFAQGCPPTRHAWRVVTTAAAPCATA